MSEPNTLNTLKLDPNDALRLVVRKDGTWDYRYAAGHSDAVVLEYLKMVVEKLEQGAYIPHD